MTEGQIKFNGDKIMEFRGKSLEEITQKEAEKEGLKEVECVKGTNLIHCAFIFGKNYKGTEEITYYSKDFSKEGGELRLYSGKKKSEK